MMRAFRGDLDFDYRKLLELGAKFKRVDLGHRHPLLRALFKEFIKVLSTYPLPEIYLSRNFRFFCPPEFTLWGFDVFEVF